MVKILFVDNTETFGGAILSLSYIVKGLDKRKYTSVVVSGHSVSFIRKHFGTIHYYKQKYTHYYYYKKPVLSWLLNHCSHPLLRKSLQRLHSILFLATFDFLYFLKLLFLCLKEKPDIIHLNNGPGAQHVPILLSWLLKKGCVAHIRGFGENYKMGAIDHILVPKVDIFIAISGYIKDQSREIGYPEQKIEVVYNFIDQAEFSHVTGKELQASFNFSQNGPKFCIIGRIVAWKGQREVIFASQNVFKTFPNCQLYIVGDTSDDEKDYYTEIKKLIKSLKLEDNIIMTGYQENVPAIIKNMDLVVHASSKPEPFGRVIIEAMAMGKPVIATAAGAPLEIVNHGSNGLLFPIDDIDSLSKLIVEVLENNDLADKLGRNGRQTVEKHYFVEQGVKKIESIYSRLIEKK